MDARREAMNLPQRPAQKNYLLSAPSELKRHVRIFYRSFRGLSIPFRFAFEGQNARKVSRREKRALPLPGEDPAQKLLETTPKSR